ncbi:MAG TPA: hypothetical protein VHM00_11975, partial [Caldimonas sp.]
YIYSGAWLGFCIGLLVIGSALQLVDPDVMRRLVVSTREAMATGADFAATIEALAPSLSGTPLAGVAKTLMLLGLALWLATLAWCVRAWRAFRQTVGVGRARAVAATTLWLALLGGLFWASRLLG